VSQYTLKKSIKSDRNYLLFSLVGTEWNPHTRKQRQFHVEQVLSINLGKVASALHRDLIEAKRAEALAVIDAHTDGVNLTAARAKQFKKVINEELPRYTIAEREGAASAYREERFNIYRHGRRMSAQSAGLAADEDVKKVLSHA